MQEVGGEFAADVAELFGAGLAWGFAQAHAGLAQAFGAFSEVTRRAGGDDVFPAGDASGSAGDDVIKGQISSGTAVLALKFIAQK